LLRGRSILVVEDEMMVLMNIEDVLRDHGCTRIASAGTVEEALAVLESESFDAGILDVNLNGKTSHPVADKLSDRGVPFVICTGYGQVALGNDYENRPVLTKPYPDDALVKALTQLLA